MPCRFIPLRELSLSSWLSVGKQAQASSGITLAKLRLCMMGFITARCWLGGNLTCCLHTKAKTHLTAWWLTLPLVTDSIHGQLKYKFPWRGSRKNKLSSEVIGTVWKIFALNLWQKHWRDWRRLPHGWQRICRDFKEEFQKAPHATFATSSCKNWSVMLHSSDL